jgi:predicted Co/Zn/Cd cation transporter (cation efflux family)
MRNEPEMRLSRVKRYFLRNPGAIFIVFFQALIVACALLLIYNNPMVDGVAVFAYCSLVVGVVLQAARSILEKTPKECV